MRIRTAVSLVARGAILVAIIVAASVFDESQLFAVNLVGVSVAFLGCAVFVVRYHVTTGGAWAHSAVGRNVMLLMACLAAALGFILSVYVFGDYPLRRPIGCALYPLIAYAAWDRVVLQYRAQPHLGAPRPDSLRRRRATDYQEGDRDGRLAP